MGAAGIVARVPVSGGVVAYEDHGGNGPVVLCLPALGGLRQEYRYLVSHLRADGYRVLTADLRGQGDSGVGFAAYTPEAVATDVRAVLDHAGIDQALLVGCSFSAGAVALAAAAMPERILGVTLVGPVMRDLPADRYLRPLVALLLAKPWGPAAWGWFYGRLFGDHPPADLSDYQQRLERMLQQPGRLAATRAMTQAPKAGVFVSLPSVTVPALIVMGERDPDFPDPTAEAALLQAQWGGEATVRVMTGVGHFPHVEQPAAVAQAMAECFRQVTCVA